MEKRELFLQALTHPTFFEGAKQAIPQDTQRLEFLGDAILDLVVGDYLYHAYPAAHEGELSKMRAALVCESALALQAKDFGLGKLLRLGKGGESSGDRYRPSVLADAFEALIGAIYEANGFMAAHSFIITHFAAAIAKLTKDDYEDRKSLLQELVQSETMYGVSYKTLRQDGPDHAPRFESGAYCKEILLGRGWGNSKKESEQAAAAAALASKSKWLPTMGYRR
jgi:ribonuclease-3